jgi:hypothetical protein
MRSMPVQTSIVSDFLQIVKNLADSVEKAFKTSPSHAAGAKEIIMNLASHTEKVTKILEGNGEF